MLTTTVTMNNKSQEKGKESPPYSRTINYPRNNIFVYLYFMFIVCYFVLLYLLFISYFNTEGQERTYKRTMVQLYLTHYETFIFCGVSCCFVLFRTIKFRHRSNFTTPTQRQWNTVAICCVCVCVLFCSLVIYFSLFVQLLFVKLFFKTQRSHSSIWPTLFWTNWKQKHTQ